MHVSARQPPPIMPLLLLWTIVEKPLLQQREDTRSHKVLKEKRFLTAPTTAVRRRVAEKEGSQVVEQFSLQRQVVVEYRQLATCFRLMTRRTRLMVFWTKAMMTSESFLVTN